MNGPNVALAPDIVAQIWDFSLKNTYVTFSLIVILALISLVFLARGFRKKPGKLQIILEELYMFFATKIEMTWLSDKKKKTLLSIVLTLFIVIILSNLFSIAPIVSSITTQLGYDWVVPLFRSPTSDFSLTIALWLFVVLGWNIMAMTISPFRYVGNFIRIGWLFKAKNLTDVGMSLLDAFLGLMDIVSEIAKILSISARLFGNIIAGEIIAIVMLFLAPYFVPIPFFILSLFSGLIQAFVFALLSMQFIAWSIENVGQQNKE